MNPAFHITPLAYIILTIVVVSILTLYYTKRSSGGDLFSKVLFRTVLFMLFHSVAILFIELFFARERWVDRLAPFALVYGPILYFAFTTIKERALSTLAVVLHLAPAISFGIIYLFLVTGIVPPTAENQATVLHYMKLASPLSFAGYTIWSVIVGRKVLMSRMKGKTLLLIFGRILLLFAAMLSAAALLSDKLKGNEQASFFIRSSIYCCMLACLLVILHYSFRKSKRQKGIMADSENVEPTLPRYEKSALSESQLKSYELRLISHVRAKQVFLDKELSLAKLAKQMKIPTHHLTQVFSIQIRKTFYQFINEMRVDAACKMLKESGNQETIENLAEQCGFNSKVSFNRNFKEITGVTPSQFRDTYRTT